MKYFIAEETMPHMTRLLILGATLVVASCVDSTGPPDVDGPALPPSRLGSVTGPGVSRSDLHMLRHDMRLTTSASDRLRFHVSGAPGDSIQLATDQASFWAVRGQTRSVRIDYLSDGSGGGVAHFLEFTVPAEGLLRRPDGSTFATGDSVLITIAVDPAELVVQFEPSGLVFDDWSPASLEVG
jgi:hypothetical protein